MGQTRGDRGVPMVFLSQAGKYTLLFIMLLFECLKYLMIFLNVKCFGTKI